MQKNILETAKSLKNTKVLCTCAIFVAFYVVLDMLQIPLTPQSRISFTFLPTAIIGCLFGAIPALLVGGLGDIVGFILHPTGAYFPGFTVTAMLSGLIYGLLLYRADQKSLFWRVIAAKLAVTALLNVLLNTCWLSILYNKGFVFYFMSRLTKNLLTLPLNIFVLYPVLTALLLADVKRMYK